MADSQDFSYFLDQVRPALGCHDYVALNVLDDEQSADSDSITLKKA